MARHGADGKAVAATRFRPRRQARTVGGDRHRAIAARQRRADVRLDGIGDRDGVRIRALRATMPQGRLDATGTLAWNPNLAWKAEATLAGFDPGYFVPIGPARSTAAAEATAVRATVPCSRTSMRAQLAATLRKAALSGRATLDVDGDAYSGDVALALAAAGSTRRGASRR